jgi:hypothetical protein
MFEQIKKNIFLKDPNNSLSIIRLTCGILGSLAIAYLCIMLIARSLHYSIFENIVIGIILLPLFWSIFALWIILSSTKFYAILKTFLPLTLLYIILG